jgi:hypothetical protein
LNSEVAQSVIELVGIEVVVGELEVVATGAKVARDEVAIGSQAIHWFMDAAGCVDGGARQRSQEV